MNMRTAISAFVSLLLVGSALGAAVASPPMTPHHGYGVSPDAGEHR